MFEETQHRSAMLLTFWLPQKIRDETDSVLRADVLEILKKYKKMK